jgi:uncharacterized protein YjiS (DUF1127 family)
MSITQELSQTVALPAANLRSMLERVCQPVSKALAYWHTRRIVKNLSDAQLRDIGVDRSMVLGNRPMISVDAGVPAYLNEMR